MRAARATLVLVLALTASGVLAGPARAQVRELDPGPMLEQPAREAHPVTAVASVGLLYVGLWGWTTAAWYVRRAEGDFTLNDEGFFSADSYAGGADKLGHLWANYALTRGVTGIFEYGGFSRGRSLVYSLVLCTGFFTFSEVKDGFHEGFGFSWQDLVMNVAGQGLGVLMVYSPALDEAVDFRVQYFPSAEFVRRVQEEGPFNAPEDYTGQTYLLAWHVGSLAAVEHSERWGWLGFVDVNLGFTAQDYLPNPGDGTAPTQHVFLGLGVNLQHVVDRTMVPAWIRAGHRFAREARRATGSGTQALGFVVEVYTPPWVILPLGGLERDGERKPEPAP